MNWLVDKSIKDIQLFYQDYTWHHKNAFSYLDDLCDLAWTKEDLNILVVGFVSNKVMHYMNLLQKRTKFFCEIIFDSQGQCNGELVLLFPSYIHVLDEMWAEWKSLLPKWHMWAHYETCGCL